MKKLYIIGAGGFGREVAWLVERINAQKMTWEIVGFLDDNKELWGKIEGGYPIVGDTSIFDELTDKAWVVCAVGNAKTRKHIVKKLMNYPNVSFATLVDPSALMSERVVLGEGTIVCAGSIITVDIVIGKHVIINLDCTIGHDVQIHDYVTIYPSVNVSGMVVVEECVELGTSSQIIQGKRIGQATIVGAGATVIRDLPQHCTAVGSPAKPIKFWD